MCVCVCGILIETHFVAAPSFSHHRDSHINRAALTSWKTKARWPFEVMNN